MPYHNVPGAQLYYETTGSGPLLLCISGANGEADIWRFLAEQLNPHFTVVRYDRRGFSRSYLVGDQDYEHRIETDADDVCQLIKHLSNDGKGTVIGNSSGAIVSLELLTRHPDVLRTLIPHEPPALKFLPDHDELRKIQHDVYNAYRKAGVPSALEIFADMIKAGAERDGLIGAFDARSGPFVAANTMYWFERELLTYPFREFNVDVLAKHKDLLLLVNGRSSDKEALQYRGNIEIGKILGLKVTELPGMHFGFATHAKEFAQELLQALKEKDDFYAKL